MLKILIAASTYPPDPGGPSIHAHAQVEGFKERGAEVSLVALAHYRMWPIGIRHFLYFVNVLYTARKVDVVYAHDAVGAGIPALVAARICGKKFVVRVGGDLAWEREAEKGNARLSFKEWYRAGLHRDNTLFKLSRFLLRSSDAAIVPSALLAHIYETYYGVSKKVIHIVPNPIPKIAGTTFQTESNTILFASRLVAYKNLAFVLEVLAPILKAHPKIKFLIMGDGPERENLQKLSDNLDMVNQVIFTGSVPQSRVLEETASCLFVIAPALTEFNPNYVLQAVGLGKPFLISQENGLPFEVPKEYTFNLSDKAELKDKVENLLRTSGYIQAQEYVKGIGFDMTWEKCLDANFAILGSLLQAYK